MPRVAVAFTGPGSVGLIEEEDRPLLEHEVPTQFSGPGLRQDAPVPGRTALGDAVWA